MARKYDLVERLKAKNERPFLVLDEQHVYSINAMIARPTLLQSWH